MLKKILFLLLIPAMVLANDLPLTPPKVVETAYEDTIELPTEEIEFYNEEIEATSIIFVIDISGSMSFNERLMKAKIELADAIRSLPSSFSFNIIAFDCSMRRWSITRREATDANKTSAISFVSSLVPMGGTGTGFAVALGLSDIANQTVLLLSDGGPNCGLTAPQHLSMIRSANARNASIHAFAISPTTTARSFLQSIAAQNNGRYVEIP